MGADGGEIESVGMFCKVEALGITGALGAVGELDNVGMLGISGLLTAGVGALESVGVAGIATDGIGATLGVGSLAGATIEASSFKLFCNCEISCSGAGDAEPELGVGLLTLTSPIG